MTNNQDPLPSDDAMELIRLVSKFNEISTPENLWSIECKEDKMRLIVKGIDSFEKIAQAERFMSLPELILHVEFLVHGIEAMVNALKDLEDETLRTPTR